MAEWEDVDGWEDVPGEDFASAIGYQDLPTGAAQADLNGWKAPEGRPDFTDLMKGTYNPEKGHARIVPEAALGPIAGKGLNLLSKFAGQLPNLQKLLRGGGQALTNPQTATQAGAGGAIEGAITGAVDPNIDAASAAGAGMLGGIGMQKASQVAAKGLNMDPRAQRLVDDGIDLTTGERLGGAWQRTEDKAQSIPFMGDSVRNAKNRSIDSFHRNRVDSALGEVGEALPANVASGRDSIAYTQDILGAKYDDVLDNMTVRQDQPFVDEVNSVLDMAQKLPDREQAAIRKTVEEAIVDPFSNPNNLQLGRTFKESDSLMRTDATKMQKSQDPLMSKAGDAVASIRDSFKEMGRRQNPDQGPALDALDRAYAKRSVNVQASDTLGAPDGVFNPSQYLNSVKKSAKGNQFAYGRAYDQQLADDAKAVMASKINNSGTTDRAAMLGVGAGFLEPSIAGAAGLGYAAYTRPGQDALNGLLFGRPNATRKAFEAYGPRSGQLGGLLGLESQREFEDEY